jgi:lipopolysaccharide biosynthesis protein
MLNDLIQPFSGAQTGWRYTPSQPRWSIVRRRWLARWPRGRGPAWKALMPAASRRRWFVYFIYLSGGQLSAAQRFALERLATEDAGLMVICACPENDPVLDELKPLCNALYWKAETGWDFSAYALGLSELARFSPGADVLVMNDSIFGPFRPLVPFMDAAPWQLTGFTGNAQEENHVQSYAFIVKNISEDVVLALEPAMSTTWSYNTANAVILWQETRLARVAARHLTVGAFWYGDDQKMKDLCLFYPKELLQSGFPFFKRSLLGKFATRFQPPEEMKVVLASLGHPLP